MIIRASERPMKARRFDRIALTLEGKTECPGIGDAGVGLTTLQRIEQNEGVVKGNFSTILKIQKALEQAGIKFSDDEAGKIGVSFQKDKR
jgi:hypothetical protein